MIEKETKAHRRDDERRDGEDERRRPGRTSSLNIDFMPSARVCSRPKGPLRLGPGRCCIRPMTRRSNQMTSSTEMSR
jgi:hypothetical protein